MENWIDIENAMPPPDVEVWITNGKGVWRKRVIGRTRGGFAIALTPGWIKLTHWQPIIPPSLPKM